MYSGKRNRIIVIGGNDAGLSAAGRAKRLNPNLEVVVLEMTPHTAYGSCGVPFLIGGTVKADLLAGPNSADLKQQRGLDVLTSHEAVEIDLRQRSVRVRDLATDKQFDLPYHKLILSTGATPIMPQVVPVEAKNVFTLRSFADALRLEQFITNNFPRRALIMGAGYLGLEIADALAQRGLQVSVIEKAGRLFPDFAAEISDMIKNGVAKRGIKLLLSSEASGFVMNDAMLVQRVGVSSAGQGMDVDLVVVAAGIRPNVLLADKAGIPLGRTGAIRINHRQETGRMDVYAAGDCAEARHIVSQKSIWAPFAQIASKQGRVAGTNAAGGRESLPGVLGTALVSAFGLEWGRTGLSLSEALSAGFAAKETVITHASKPAYAPNGQAITVALIADSHSRQLLGGQIIGASGAGLRLNVLAAAVAARLTLHDLSYLDLGYTPAISNVWDPLLVAGSAAMKKTKEQ